MVLDTGSIHLENRDQLEPGPVEEGQTTTNMETDVANHGIRNGYTNAAYVAGADENLPKGSRIDFGAEALQRVAASPKRNVVSPVVDPQVYPSTDVASPPKEVPFPRDTDPCGICCWAPRCLQSLATGRTFVFFCSLLSLTEAGLTIGYISSVVTSIERNFNFSSTLTGFVISCYDIGTLLVVLTSYYGGRPTSNRPKWIAWSAWTMSLGACIVPMSHFISGTYAASSSNTTDPMTCSLASGSGGNTPTVSPGSGEEENTCSGEPQLNALWFLIPGMLLIGAGSTAMFTLGTTYIDDYVRKSEAPILLAIFFCTTVVGPGVGFVVGFLVLGIYVDFDIVSADDLKSTDPEWLGAWWLGFFICAATIAVTAIPVYAFPARLIKPTSDEDRGKRVPVTDSKSVGGGSKSSKGGEPVTMAFGQVSIKQIPPAIWSLMKNPVYMMINIASAVEFSIVTGFVRFSPKFIEYQFDLTASTANLITGMLVPAGAIGVVIGGIILNRVKRDLKTTINVLIIFTLTSGSLYAFVFIPGSCPTLSMAGVTSSYYYSDSNWQRPADSHQVNLTSSCNALCGCGEWDYVPVCGANGVTYFSPCHAGCSTQHELPPNVDSESQRELVNYTNCTCVDSYIPQGAENSTNAALRESFRTQTVEVLYDGLKFTYEAQSLNSGVSGQCTEECDKIITFICLLLVVVCVTSIVQMPALMTTLRSVKEEERPFALGFQFVIIRLLGYIPAPIYYGAVIDNACLLWQNTCTDRKGSCLEYDNERYFYNYLVLSTGLKMISVAMAVLCFIVVRRKYGRGQLRLYGEDGDSSQAGGSEMGRSNVSLATNAGDATMAVNNNSCSNISVISDFKMEQISS